jgi:hypothetical protein
LITCLGIFAFALGQHHAARMALNQRCDLAVLCSEDQIAFPVTVHGGILCRHRSFAY